MCTVTRPGLAAIASSSAVELLCSMLQHPEGCANNLYYSYSGHPGPNANDLFHILYRLYAPAPPNDPKAVPGNTAEEQGEGTSILGLIPHQIRGYLGQFRNILVTGQQYDKCTGCSETVRPFRRSQKNSYFLFSNTYRIGLYLIRNGISWRASRSSKHTRKKASPCSSGRSMKPHIWSS